MHTETHGAVRVVEYTPQSLAAVVAVAVVAVVVVTVVVMVLYSYLISASCTGIAHVSENK